MGEREGYKCGGAYVLEFSGNELGDSVLEGGGLGRGQPGLEGEGVAAGLGVRGEGRARGAGCGGRTWAMMERAKADCMVRGEQNDGGGDEGEGGKGKAERGMAVASAHL